MKKINYFLFLVMSLLLISCSNEKKIIIYTSVDQNISEVIFNAFEEETGIKVLAVYDIEASKTTGLTNRLIAEKNNPQADVFWNSEILMTIKLKEEGVFQRFTSDESSRLPTSFVDEEGYWIGFGGRGRIILVNKDLITKEDYPTSIFDFVDDKYKSYDKVIANPIFGTTMTHSIVLNNDMKVGEIEAFFLKAKENNTQIVDGNSVVRDLVASGDAAFGLTDTDDAFSAIKKGMPVEIIYPDQIGIGTLIIPNTVAMIKDAKNSKEAQIFIDYLLSKDTEDKLLALGFFNIADHENFNYMICDFEESYLNIGDLIERLREILIN